MDVALSEDQGLLLDTTRRFLAAESPISAVRALVDEPAGFDSNWWRRAAALGWTSMLVPEALGGGSLSEHGLVDLVLVAEEIGRAVAPGPLIAVNVVASAVARAGTPTQQAEVLPSLLDGTAVATWCPPAPSGGFGAGAVSADRAADGTLVLHGTAAPVEAGAQADHLLVSVAASDGVCQVLVPANTDGLTITALGGLDLVRRFAEVRFDGVRVAPESVLLGDAATEIEQQLQTAVVLQCAELCGVADRVFAMTLEYLGDRYSFGRPLASYQALKHRVADRKLDLESCHAIATAAARAVADGADDAGELASAAKSWIGPHVTELVQDAIQLHGGIGVTWEHDLHLYLRRATVDRLTYGTPEEHRERIAHLLLGAAS